VIRDNVEKRKSRSNEKRRSKKEVKGTRVEKEQ
jgi:hypothetical protein